jgi:hypothetical protein
MDHLRIATVRDWPRFIGGDPYGRYAQLGHGLKHIEGWDHFDLPSYNAEEDAIPAAEASLDGIATYNMLDHISDPRWPLIEAGRVLVDEGWFVSIVPHYLGELSHSCFDHKSQFAVDSWRNALDNKHDPSQEPIPFDLGFNMIMGLSENNLFLVTQMIRKPRDR